MMSVLLLLFLTETLFRRHVKTRLGGEGRRLLESHNVFLFLPAALFMKVCLVRPPLREQFVQRNRVFFFIGLGLDGHFLFIV